MIYFFYSAFLLFFSEISIHFYFPYSLRCYHFFPFLYFNLSFYLLFFIFNLSITFFKWCAIEENLNKREESFTCVLLSIFYPHSTLRKFLDFIISAHASRSAFLKSQKKNRLIFPGLHMLSPNLRNNQIIQLKEFRSLTIGIHFLNFPDR